MTKTYVNDGTQYDVTSEGKLVRQDRNKITLDKADVLALCVSVITHQMGIRDDGPVCRDCGLSYDITCPDYCVQTKARKIAKECDK